ncbi:Transcription factor hamlet [Porphyridium purpureum]|uniref:Transcription factor hamlet n=1 Tax=Porphyridium purpureum TaxID=35688 RepID=A0A5J4Z2E5_PORPP|nr:Transcription factor hamlet [Porphyridium purpureum]|eukprot:POR4832..scf295_1
MMSTPGGPVQAAAYGHATGAGRGDSSGLRDASVRVAAGTFKRPREYLHFEAPFRRFLLRRELLASRADETDILMTSSLDRGRGATLDRSVGNEPFRKSIAGAGLGRSSSGTGWDRPQDMSGVTTPSMEMTSLQWEGSLQHQAQVYRKQERQVLQPVGPPAEQHQSRPPPSQEQLHQLPLPPRLGHQLPHSWPPQEQPLQTGNRVPHQQVLVQRSGSMDHAGPSHEAWPASLHQFQAHHNQRAGGDLKLSKDLTYNCPSCLLCFARKPDLYRHVRTVHLGLKRFACPTCGRLFGTSGNMRKHMRNVHEASGRLSGSNAERRSSHAGRMNRILEPHSSSGGSSEIDLGTESGEKDDAATNLLLRIDPQSYSAEPQSSPAGSGTESDDSKEDTKSGIKSGEKEGSSTGSDTKGG